MISGRGRGRVAVTILKYKDVYSLEVDMDLMEADRVPLRKAPSNVGIVDVAITSPKVLGDIWTF